MFRAGEGAFAGMQGAIPGYCDNEAAQTTAASAREPNVETPGQAAGGPAPSSSSGSSPAAGGPAPEDVNTGAERSAAQPTSSVVRTLEAEDDGGAKRQRLMGRDANPA